MPRPFLDRHRFSSPGIVVRRVSGHSITLSVGNRLRLSTIRELKRSQLCADEQIFRADDSYLCNGLCLSGRIFPMEPLRDLGRSFVLFGGLLVLIGVFLYFGNKLPFRLGKLPGDIVHRGEHTTFYFPIVTCLVLSVVLSLLFWLVSHFRR